MLWIIFKQIKEHLNTHTHIYIGTRGALYVLKHEEQFCNWKAKLLNLWAALWKVCVTSVKPNSWSQFTPLTSQSMGLCTLIYMDLYCPSCLGCTAWGGIAGYKVHCSNNHSFMTQRPKLLQLIAINSLGYVVLDLSVWGGAQGTVSFLFYPFKCFLWADWDFLVSVDQESCHFPASRWAISMSGVSSSLPVAHRRLQQQHLKACPSLQWS